MLPLKLSREAATTYPRWGNVWQRWTFAQDWTTAKKPLISSQKPATMGFFPAEGGAIKLDRWF
jgi:hypothetical protein